MDRFLRRTGGPAWLPAFVRHYWRSGRPHRVARTGGISFFPRSKPGGDVLRLTSPFRQHALKRSAGLAGAMLLAPLLLFGEGPDYWVKFSAGDGDIPAATVPGGKLRRVALVVGNAGTPGRKDPLVSLTAFSVDGGSKICEVSETIKPPHLEDPVAPLAFQIFYPDAKPDTDKQRKDHRTARYKLIGTVAESDSGSAREDQNESNNRIEATFTVPAGGVASCIKLQ